MVNKQRSPFIIVTMCRWHFLPRSLFVCWHWWQMWSAQIRTGLKITPTHVDLSQPPGYMVWTLFPKPVVYAILSSYCIWQLLAIYTCTD